MKLKKLLKKVKKRFFAKSPQDEKSKNSVSLYRYDRHTVETAVDRNPELSRLIETGEKTQPGFSRLFEDIYGALQKAHPTLLPKEAIEPEYQVNRDHLKDIMGSDNFDDLRQTTKLNKSLALTTAQELARNILAQSPEEASKRRELEYERKRLQDLIERAEEIEAGGASEETQERYAEAVERLAGEVEDLEEEISQMSTGSFHKSAAEEDIKEASEKVNGLVEMLGKFGYSQDELSRVSPDRMLRMLDSVYDHRQLKDMMEIIGRFRKVARELLSKATQRDHFTISGITMGDEIADMTDYEAMNALNPISKIDFMGRWSDAELEIHERDDEVPSGKGPMIICDDVSGTMQSGERDPYAKGLMMACLEIARKEHRDMHVIYYNDDVVKEVSIRKGRILPEELTEALTFCPGGGTNFERPLERTTHLIRTSALQRADVLFLTDGLAPISDEFAKWFAKERKRMDFKVVSVLIPDDLRGEQREQCEERLQSVSDYQLSVDDLTDKSAKAVIGKMFALT